MKARLLVDAGAQLGECALWCGLAGVLYWTDIEGATVSRWREADNRVRRWTLPERVGSFALCAEPSRLLLGLASGIALFDLEREELSPVVLVEPECPCTRINDGRCDPQGRFVFGMFDQSPEPGPVGGFYRVDANLAIERLPLPPAAVANSIAFSPDGSLMYYTDSPTREIRCCDYHADGRIGASRPFARLKSGDGAVPDGSAVDAEGGLWNAQWGGGRIVRYGPGGEETARIEVPVLQPSCVAFGGSALDRLFITSARQGLAAEALRAERLSGGVFAAEPGWRGLPEHRFGAGRGR